MDTSEETTKGKENRTRVLIVEDDVDTACALAELLQELACEVSIAEDGTAAIWKAYSFRPDIILLDIGLPAMDGYRVARLLREMPELSTALIVAITGYGETEDKKRAYEVGIDLHLTKPVKVKFLKELIATYGKV
jgi:CheY-like chemotaxis protein